MLCRKWWSYKNSYLAFKKTNPMLSSLFRTKTHHTTMLRTRESQRPSPDPAKILKALDLELWVNECCCVGPNGVLQCNLLASLDFDGTTSSALWLTKLVAFGTELLRNTEFETNLCTLLFGAANTKKLPSSFSALRFTCLPRSNKLHSLVRLHTLSSWLKSH